MSSIKYRYPGLFENLELVSAEPIKGDETKKPKIQLNFASALRVGQGIKARTISRDTASELGIYWKCKVSPEIFQQLKDLGFKPSCICSIYAAVDNWGSQADGGTWFEFLELPTLDGRSLNFVNRSVEAAEFTDPIAV